jgi:RNA polymerase sigma factor (sigma-70 family)
MVLGVCNRVLRNVHDAEDAFQATFLVLAAKAATISPRDAVGAWLYGVACRTAMKAKAMTAKRRLKELEFGERHRDVATDEDVWDELRSLLDEELGRLPQKYQSAIVLCDLEGKTKREAAGQLRCPEGTLSSWLARGRRMLAKRLARRGVGLSAGSLAAVLSHNAASASVRCRLVSSTGKAASLFAARQAAAEGVISANVAALTEGVLNSMLLSKLKIALAIGLIAGALGAGVSLHSYHLRAAEPIKLERPNPFQYVAANPATEPRSADDAVQTQIACILKAHGGEENLEKLKTFSWKVKTTSLVSGDRRDYHFTVRLPDQLRAEMNYIGRETGTLVIVQNKDITWRKVNDGETAAHKALAEEVVRFLGPRGLLKLKDPAMKVTLLGERMAGDTAALLGDRAAVCLELERKDRKNFVPLHECNVGAVNNVRLYFDKASSLLLKEEFDYGNSHFEIFHSEYKLINGIAVAQKMTQKTNDEVNDRTEVEFKIEDKLDSKLFEKP